MNVNIMLKYYYSFFTDRFIMAKIYNSSRKPRMKFEILHGLIELSLHSEYHKFCEISKFITRGVASTIRISCGINTGC